VDFSNFEIAIVDDFRRTGERRLLAGKRPLIGQQLSDFGLLGHLDTKGRGHASRTQLPVLLRCHIRRGSLYWSMVGGVTGRILERPYILAQVTERH
jgi:hypothetical protein